MVCEKSLPTAFSVAFLAQKRGLRLFPRVLVDIVVDFSFSRVCWYSGKIRRVHLSVLIAGQQLAAVCLSMYTS